jgi:hypothetical protein
MGDERTQRERMLACDPYRADDPELVRDCDYGYQVRVGARTFVNFGLVALDVATITIATRRCTARVFRDC